MGSVEKRVPNALFILAHPTVLAAWRNVGRRRASCRWSVDRRAGSLILRAGVAGAAPLYTKRPATVPIFLAPPWAPQGGAPFPSFAVNPLGSGFWGSFPFPFGVPGSGVRFALALLLLPCAVPVAVPHFPVSQFAFFAGFADVRKTYFCGTVLMPMSGKRTFAADGRKSTVLMPMSGKRTFAADGRKSTVLMLMSGKRTFAADGRKSTVLMLMSGKRTFATIVSFLVWL
jgi:hypothetical protein